jgi:hypothetical protein
MATIANLLINLGLDTAKLSTGARKATSTVSSMMSAIASKVVIPIDPVALLGNAKQAVEAMGAFIVDEIKKLDDLSELAGRLDLTTEALTRLQFAALRTGSNADGLQMVLERMNKSLGNATPGSKLAETFDEIGLSVQRLRALNPEDRLAAIADATNRIEDPTRRAALRAEILGKSYGELKLLLDGGSEAMARFAAESDAVGNTTFQAMAEQAAMAQDQFDLIAAHVAAIKRDMAIAFAPEIMAHLEMLLLVSKNGPEFAKQMMFGGMDDLYANIRGGKQAAADRAAEIRAQAADAAKNGAVRRKAGAAADEMEQMTAAAEKVEKVINNWRVDSEMADESKRMRDIEKLTAEGGINDDQIGWLHYYAEQLDAADALKKAEKERADAEKKHAEELAELVKEGMSPLEEHEARLVKIDEAWERDLLTAEAYWRLVAKSEKELADATKPEADPVRDRAKERREELSEQLKRDAEQRRIREEFEAGALTRDEASAAHLLAELEFRKATEGNAAIDRPAALERGTAAAFSASFGAKADPNTELLKQIREILRRIETEAPEAFTL